MKYISKEDEEGHLTLTSHDKCVLVKASQSWISDYRQQVESVVTNTLLRCSVK